MIKATTVPSIVTLPGELPAARYIEWARAEALRMDPASPAIAEARALESSEAKRGIAKAARMPRIVMTTTNSIRVKPCCNLRM